MLTSLDLLVIVFMVLVGVIILALSLMYLLKNKKIKKVMFYGISILTICLAFIGLDMGITGFFLEQIILGFLVIIMTITLFILERVYKDKEKAFLITRVISSIALLLGFMNIFFI